MDETVILDDVTSVWIKAEATYGDLLISSLLAVLIVIIVTIWLHSVIMGGRRRK